MRSPFPGMDPYLEQHWLDVHHALATYARDQLQRKLPRDLRARIEERVFVEFDDEGRYRGIHPDVRIIEHPSRDTAGAQPEGGVATAEPIVVRTADDPISQGYIEIIDASSGNRVVTVIEFVSPSNKVPGQGQDLYLRKQREVLAAKASLVEVDLTRAGHRALAARMTIIPPQYHATYLACVTRGWKWGWSEIYPLPLAQQLPAIRVPLRQSDADVPLDLQALIDQCYENGGYDTIDYRQPLEPPLGTADAVWAEESLRGKGIMCPVLQKEEVIGMVTILPSSAATEREWNFRDDINQEFMCDIPECQEIISLKLNWKPDEATTAKLVGKYRFDLGLMHSEGFVRKNSRGTFLRFQRTGEIIEIALNRHSPALVVGRAPR